MAVSDGGRHALILRNEVRRLLGEDAPEVSDEMIDALAKHCRQEPWVFYAALRVGWERP